MVVAARRRMMIVRLFAAGVVVLGISASAAAQAPPPPPPLWDAQVGATFVGTSGNSETSTVGADFSMHRRWPVWQIESTATAVRNTDRGERTAERYLASLRGQRRLTDLLSFSTGERVERDRFSGIDFRSILDGGLNWALIRAARWTLDGITAIAWLHEERLIGSDKNNPIGLFQALSRVAFGTAGNTAQRIAFYPDFRDRSAYRTEAELTAQAAMNSRLALKVGYLLRYSNDPVPGFKKTDNTTTASIVLGWRSAATVP
jgi:putative salt-induced outer membrane protein